MKRFLKFICPEYSNWEDICVYDRNGHYTLIQMRYNLNNNKKKFRKEKLGFINDSIQKSTINYNIKTYNLD